jgi:hypothetical protein
MTKCCHCSGPVEHGMIRSCLECYRTVQTMYIDRKCGRRPCRHKVREHAT